MGSKSSKEGCTMNDDGKESVINTIKHHYKPKKNEDDPEEYCQYDDQIYMTDFWWNYKAAGKNNFHRFLEFKFVCNKCNFSKFVRTDKIDTGKKNICTADNLFKQSNLYYYHFTPKKNYYTIDNIIYLYDKARSGYNLFTNNCKDYAQYFWDNIRDCNGN